MKKMIRILGVIGLAFLLMIPAGVVWGADTFSYSWEKVGFATPMPFSEPARLGLDAVVLVSPPEAAVGKARLELVLALVPKDLQEGLGNNDTEIMNYVKSTFLGTAAPATGSTERSFLGTKCQGDVQKTTIPQPGEMEVFLVPLSDGDKMAVALTRAESVPAEDAGAVMDMVSRTFKEIKAD